MKENHSWGWPIAIYLFLGGLGGGMTIVSTAADLFFGQGDVFALGNFIASILIGMGSALLIFELGKPLRFWRVFSTQKAIMTVGAWLLAILIVAGTVNFTFWLPFIPWNHLVVLRKILSGINLLLGAAVVTYTGYLLASKEARPFWNSAVLPILFAISGVSSGIAAQTLLAGTWPWHGSPALPTQASNFLYRLNAGFMLLELLILLVFMGMMRTGAGEAAKRAAARWLTGKHRLLFWGGLIGLGLLLPLALLGFGVQPTIISPICVIAGALFLRFLVVYSDDRSWLPGEEKYYARLPLGDETFLKALK